IGKRPAVVDHKSTEVLKAGTADRDDAAVAVRVALVTGHRTCTDELGQGERGLLAAAIRLTGSLAGLPRLRSIDAEQPDALAVDRDCVAVDDRRLARKVGCDRADRPTQPRDQQGREDPLHTDKLADNRSLR